MKLHITLLLLNSWMVLIGQEGIHFVESISYDNAISLAKQSNKNIFIDTYADWCIPCKKMEIEFLNSEVSSFFNQNYINIRINMEHSPFASEYRKKFDVVFLPTMIILDPHGNVKYKTDKIIPGRELMGIALKSMNPNIFFESDASKISNSPVSKPSTNQPSPRSLPEKIVYAAGYGKNINPQFLYQEAYFRIELMDGSHHEVADRYLETQTDWGTEKNMRFIFDFLHSTSSKKFKYFVRHRNDFEQLLGKENVTLTLEFLINDRLQNGFPRPTIEESRALYKILDSIHYEEKAYSYFLPRLINECKYVEYQKYGQEYLDKFDQNDHGILFTMSEECLGTPHLQNDRLDYCIDKIKQAIAIESNIPVYYESLAKLYYKNNKRKKAKKAIKIAIKLAKELGFNHHAYQRFLDEISG